MYSDEELQFVQKNVLLDRNVFMRPFRNALIDPNIGPYCDREATQKAWLDAAEEIQTRPRRLLWPAHSKGTANKNGYMIIRVRDPNSTSPTRRYQYFRSTVFSGRCFTAPSLREWSSSAWVRLAIPTHPTVLDRADGGLQLGAYEVTELPDDLKMAAVSVARIKDRTRTLQTSKACALTSR